MCLYIIMCVSFGKLHICKLFKCNSISQSIHACTHLYNTGLCQATIPCLGVTTKERHQSSVMVINSLLLILLSRSSLEYSKKLSLCSFWPLSIFDGRQLRRLNCH